MVKKSFIVLILLAISSAVHAQAPKILEGYGKTKWGQSVEEVMKAVPGLAKSSESGGYSSYTVKGDAPITEIIYSFIEDRLYDVWAIYQLPKKEGTGMDDSGVRTVQEMVNKKYYKDKESRAMLTKAGIRITANNAPESKVLVSYLNSRLLAKQEQKLQEARENKDQERSEAIQELGIEDTL